MPLYVVPFLDRRTYSFLELRTKMWVEKDYKQQISSIYVRFNWFDILNSLSIWTSVENCYATIYTSNDDINTWFNLYYDIVFVNRHSSIIDKMSIVFDDLPCSMDKSFWRNVISKIIVTSIVYEHATDNEI